MLVGVQTRSLKIPFKKALPRIAAMGAVAVELDARDELRPSQVTDTGLRQIRKWLNDHQLKVSAVSFRTRRGYDVAEDLERRVEATKEAMQLAFALGCSTVVNQVGRIAADETDNPNWRRLVDALSDLGRFGERTGAWLAMATGSEDGADMLKLIDALPTGSVKVNFDPGSLIINGFSASEAAAILGQHIVHVHARDAVRDLARGRGLEVALGRGSVDFPELMGVLEEHGYRGYFTVIREHSEHPLEEVGLAVQYLSNVH